MEFMLGVRSGVGIEGTDVVEGALAQAENIIHDSNFEF
jgi:hypothetical protein